MQQPKKKKRKQNKNGLSFVENLIDFKKLLNNNYYEYRIALGGTAGALFSKKYIYYDKKEKKAFNITNCIDNNKQTLTQKQLMSKKYTNIGEALKKHCLIVNLKEKTC